MSKGNYMDKFYAGTKLEILERSGRAVQHFHLKYLLTHEGEFHIFSDGIMLGSWRKVNWDMIREITMEDDEVLSAKMFATQARLFFLKSAKPIKLLLVEGEVIYLYVNWKFGIGLSANVKVYEQIKEKCNKT